MNTSFRLEDKELTAEQTAAIAERIERVEFFTPEESRADMEAAEGALFVVCVCG